MIRYDPTPVDLTSNFFVLCTTCIIKVRKRTKVRNRYNQAPHLTQDTNGKVTTAQLGITNECQEVNPFPAGDHKASINRRARQFIYIIIHSGWSLTRIYSWRKGLNRSDVSTSCFSQHSSYCIFDHWRLRRAQTILSHTQRMDVLCGPEHGQLFLDRLMAGTGNKSNYFFWLEIIVETVLKRSDGVCICL